MGGFERTSENASVVILGAFNPAIVQPSWLGVHGVVTAAEAAGAEVTVIHPDISAFRVGELYFETQKQRLLLLTSDPGRYIVLPALAAQLLGLMEHTPVTAFGINWIVGYRAQSAAHWNGVGDMLAPKGVWRSHLDSPGMQSLSIRGRRPGSGASVLVKVDPTNSDRHELAINFNEHHTTGFGDTATLAEAVHEHWKPAHAAFRTIVESVLQAPPREDS